MARTALLIILFAAVALGSGCGGRSQAESIPRTSIEEKRFDELVAKYPDMTYEQLASENPKRDYMEQLSFDPSQAKFYDETVKELQLTNVEQKLLGSHGFVSVDHDQRYSFGSVYYAIYTRDLPVLVTTDSILHALHRSYDDMLIELEQSFFTATIDSVLSKCHDELAATAPTSGADEQSCQDVDLYLTVARNLLAGAGAPQADQPRREEDKWDGRLFVRTKLGQDEEVQSLLHRIQSLELQTFEKRSFTMIYGGKRAIDYSQFQPRGHYTSTPALARYFRAMMWLGREDTGWNVLPPDRESGMVSDCPRELRNAVLLTQLLKSTGATEQLRKMSDILDLMIGESDFLTLFQLERLLAEQKVNGLGDLASADQIDKLHGAIRENRLGEQRIRSQVILSDPMDLHQVPPPRTCRMFGQRFVIDSFVLSKVVYDSILFDGQKVRRKMPTGVDVMFALGNDTALPLLKAGMKEFPYASNLKASQEFIGQYQPAFWRGNLYNLWLDALRTLDADVSNEKHVPQAMRTKAWQRKQLQTQLASWSELRHNTVLYASQSYTANEKCEYPTGYVEPYPDTYAKLKDFATEAARRIGASEFTFAGGKGVEIQKKQVAFFERMAQIVGKLETLARKELAAEPFSDEDQAWIKKAIDRRGGGSGPPSYDGWYAELFYRGGDRCAAWEPTVIDVHTDPDSKSVLEEGVGNCNFIVVAVDNEDDHMIYVGPAYSYYDFTQPAENRLTDVTWHGMLTPGREPQRPDWTEDFQSAAAQRLLSDPRLRKEHLR